MSNIVNKYLITLGPNGYLQCAGVDRNCVKELLEKCRFKILSVEVDPMCTSNRGNIRYWYGIGCQGRRKTVNCGLSSDECCFGRLKSKLPIPIKGVGNF